MTWITIDNLPGKVYFPDNSQTCNKHACKDCFACQQCSSERCRVCRNEKAVSNTSKKGQ